MFKLIISKNSVLVFLIVINFIVQRSRSSIIVSDKIAGAGVAELQNLGTLNKAVISNNKDDNDQAIQKEQSSSRQERVLSGFVTTDNERDNEVENQIPRMNDNEIDSDPNAALKGVYSECLINLSFPCLQRKVLVFLDRLGRMNRFSVLGDVITVVRTRDVRSKPLSEDVLASREFSDENTLKQLMDMTVDNFFDSHVIRITVPAFFEDNGRSSTTLDLKVGDNGGLTEEGRRRKGGGGKMKGMKKMMMMMGMMMMMKMTMLGPMMMGLIGLAAIKGLIFSIISITISKILILKKLKMGGGKDFLHGKDSEASVWPSSGGGGGHGSSGGGWDRSFGSHPLVYRAYTQ